MSESALEFLNPKSLNAEQEIRLAALHEATRFIAAARNDARPRSTPRDVVDCAEYFFDWVMKGNK